MVVVDVAGFEPTNLLRVEQALYLAELHVHWLWHPWFRAESNRRPVAFQTTALPTELQNRELTRAGRRGRTADFLLTRQALYHLSYSGKVVRMRGLEPPRPFGH